mmetsp:Transcript_30190/g.79847  ORF Transcript_30190/g.79847 Transcript_30190/m.79847 type:complete len:219 (+) Transcript_30190:298-954(+)
MRCGGLQSLHPSRAWNPLPLGPVLCPPRRSWATRIRRPCTPACCRSSAAGTSPRSMPTASPSTPTPWRTARRCSCSASGPVWPPPCSPSRWRATPRTSPRRRSWSSVSRSGSSAPRRNSAAPSRTVRPSTASSTGRPRAAPRSSSRAPSTSAMCGCLFLSLFFFFRGVVVAAAGQIGERLFVFSCKWTGTEGGGVRCVWLCFHITRLLLLLAGCKCAL